MGTKDSGGQGLLEFSELVWVTAGVSPGLGQSVSILAQGFLESWAEFWLCPTLIYASYGTLDKSFHLPSTPPYPLWSL